MSSQSYYREKQHGGGFEPRENENEGGTGGEKAGYEESLTKFKDERDAIQKKTFTKWVNKHLTKDWRRAKCGKRVGDLFEDLRDGHNLVSLLEVLAGEHLPRERGRMRFHMLQNVQTVLDFLRYRKIKLVNIRAEDIVDGNPKLTLGLIWTIILHFQISDIVVGMEENVSAKDVLLKWAQKSTAKYPGVRVGDFTNSWRDGLAFNAIIHRNRPDLIDWRAVQRRSPRERLETAFSAAERECGVTRLLDAEDVDTLQPDEKSLITYISSLYDAFPEPPRLHPLHDTDSQKKWEEYRETATTLYTWIRESITLMQDRSFPSSLIEMRRMGADMNRFRVEEVPARAHSKQRLSHLFRDVEKHFRDGEIDRELHIENIERSWQVLLMSHQEKDQAIQDEIKKLDKLQRLAEKVHREAKQVESRLDDHEQRIDEEARRIDRLHPLDAKNNVDHLERDMAMTEEGIKSMFNDTQMLSDARFQQAPELNRIVQHLHQRWISIRTSLQNRLQSVLASISFGVEEKSVSRMSKTVLETRLVETDPNFRKILEVSEWIKNKQKQLIDADYGSDLPSVQAELEKQLKEHRVIERYQTNIERCSAAKSSFRGDELQLYITYLNNVQKSYAELLMSSKKRQSDLETLLDFVQSATNELIWLSEKEEREITRDWSSKSLNLVEVEQYYEALMSELEKREIQFNAVQDRGESLVLQHHPASKCIETYMSSLSTQWAWLLQLTLCLETHLKHVANYQQYFSNVRECEQSIARQEELLNSIFSKSDFSLDEGEILLKEMQELRDELTRYGDFVQAMTNESGEIIPLKQRKTNVSRPLTVTAICSYRQNNQQMVIAKDERCGLLDNSQRVRWRIRNSSGLEGMVPGVCFLIPPPDKEAVDAADRIRKQYDRCVTLWQKKQLKMRQNMIFATIKVVKSWDLTQFLGMGSDQRNAIRKALNEDAEKLIQEGDPNDPALRRLRREIDEVNRLFDQFEKEASDAEKTKNTSKIFTEQVQTLQTELEEVERTLTSRVNAVLPRDLSGLERIVMEHKEFESKLETFESRIESVQRTYSSIPQKTAPLQAKMDKVVEKWERVWNLTHLYVERLKCVEVVLGNLEETTSMVSKFEMKLGSYENMPTDENEIRKVSEELYNLQNTSQINQHVVEQLVEDTKNVRHVVEKSRGPQKRHPDVEKLEDEVHRTTTRWTNASSEIVDRLRSVEQSSEMASRYNSSYQTEMNWLDTIDTKTKSLPLMESGGRAKGKIQPHMTLYNSVIEEKITIEQVNTMGARLAKEAKTYDTKLEEFRSSLEQVNPSSSEGSLVKKPKMESAPEMITNNLDLLNLKYQVLVDNLYHRLQQLSQSVKQEEPTTEFSLSKVPGPSPLRTYRSMSRDSMPKTDEDTVDNVVQRSSAEITLAAAPSPKKRSVLHLKNGDRNGNPGESNGNHGDLIGSPLSPKLHFSQIRSGARKPHEEGISTETALLVPLLIDPLTGERLTLAQAIGCGLIDIKTGEFIDPKTKRRMSLPEAAEHGYILDSGILQKLLGVCGLVDPQTGAELTLLESIRLGWYDLSKGCFINPKTGEPMSSEQAIRLGIQTQSQVSTQSPDHVAQTATLQPGRPPFPDSSCTTSSTIPSPLFTDLVKSGRVDLRSGQVQTGSSQTLPEALGGTGVEDSGNEEQEGSSCLSDLIDQGLVTWNPIDGSMGVKDRFSGEVLSVTQAVTSGILNPSVTEIYSVQKGNRITLSEAIKCQVLDPEGGTWRDEVTGTSWPLATARRKSLVMKPLSLKDCVDLDLVREGEGGRLVLVDPVTNEERSLLELIASGTLDFETKTVTDSNSERLVTLQEALARGIVTPEGLVRDTRTGVLHPIRDAASRGLLSAVKRTSIFSIPCVVDPKSQQNVSVCEALESGVINAKTRTVKVGGGKLPVPFDLAGAKGVISAQVFPTLNTPSGIYDPRSKGKELTVLEAIVTEKILPSGEVFDERGRKYVPMDTAVESGPLDPEKANFLKGLYNINLTTATVTKTVRHVITIERTEETYESRKIGFQEALERKLIDEETGTFTDPETGEASTVVEAVSKGLLGLSSEWPDDFGKDQSEGEGGSLDKVPVSALNRELLHLPLNGWPLREMIRSELFEPVGGLFAIPGTDRLVSFEECVRLKIIDPTSAEVIDDNNRRRIPLLRSLEKQILDTTGHYHYAGVKGQRPLTLQEAIAAGVVILLPEDPEVRGRAENHVHPTVQTGPTPMEIDEQVTPSAPPLVDGDVPKCRPVPLIQVTDCLTFDPNSVTVRDSTRNEEVSLFDAVVSGRIEPRKVKVRDPVSGQELNVNEAIRKGIVDKKTGMVKVKGEKASMTFGEALKLGAIAVVAAPILGVKALVEKVGAGRDPAPPPQPTARQRSVTPERILSAATLTSVPEEGYAVVSEEIIPCESILTTTTTVTTTSVIVTKISRIPVPMDPREFLDSGLVDNTTLLAITNPENYVGPAGEKLTLGESIAAGKIDGDSGAVLDPQTQQLLTINEALVQNILTHDGNIVLPIARSLSIPELKSQGLYDPQEQKVIHPETGNSLTILEAMASDILNPLSPVKHPVSRRKLSLAQALEQNVVCPETGSVIEGDGPRVPLLQALQQGSFDDVQHPYDEFLPPATLTLEAAVKRGLANLETNTIYNPATNETSRIEDAIEHGQLIPSDRKSETGSDRFGTDPKGRKIKASQAHPSPVRTSALKVTFKEPSEPKKPKVVVVPGYAQLDPERLLPLTVEVDLGSGRVKIPSTEGDYSLEEALEEKVLNPKAVVVIPGEEGKPLEMSLGDAVVAGVDLKAIQVKNPETGTAVSFTEALKLGLLAVAGAPVMVGKVSRVLATPVPPIRGVEIKSHAKKPLASILKPGSTPAKDADEMETVEETTADFVANYQKPWPLHVAVALGKYNPDTGLLQLDSTGEFVTLETGIEAGEIDPVALTCRDPRTKALISLQSAILSGLVNPKSGTLIDPISGAELSLDQGMKSGLLLRPARKISLPEVIYAGNFDPVTNTITDAGKSIPLKTAIEQKLVTVDTLVVKNFATLGIVPFKVALAEGLIDPDLGTVRTGPTAVCSIVEALETGILVEVTEHMSLSEVIHKGLHREEDGKFMDPKTGLYITLAEALTRKIIDPETVNVKDTREGFEKKMPLTVAIQSGFISGDTGTVHDYTTKEELPLRSALEKGLIVDSRMPISVQKAIHLGLYSEETGKLTDPNTGKRVTLHESIRRLIVNPNLPCYWDEAQGKVLSLVETCRAGIIARQQGVFHVPPKGAEASRGAATTLNLSDALEQGYILNIEKPFSLYEALKIGLYEKSTGKFVHPSTGKRLTLEEAWKQELINPDTSILVSSDSRKILPLPFAVSQGLVDPVQGTYIHPGKGPLPLDEAKRKGLVLTPERPLPLEQIVVEHLYDPESGKMADPLLCDWLTTEQGLKTGLVDPSRTAIQDLGTQRIKSLRAALDDGEVDSGKGTVLDARNKVVYPYDKAVHKGLILTVDPPITFSEALGTGAIDLRRGTFCDPRNSITSSLSDAVGRELIDPGSAVVRDPQTQTFVTLRQAGRSGLIDIKKRALIERPSGKLKPLVIIFEEGTVVFLREPMTFDQARDRGYLDLLTGQFHDPLTEGTMSLKEALDIHAIEPKSAVIKDVLKKRLVPLGEGYTLALVDPEKSTVFNSANNHLLPLSVALDSGLVLTPRTPFGLITALDYSLYNPSTGRFTNPYGSGTKGREVTLGEGLESGLLEPNTTVIRDPVSRRILPLTLAITERIVDPEEGTLVDPSTSSRQNLLDAWKKGLVVPAEARLATEEKYRTCTTTMNSLFDWLTEVEKRLGSQESVRETLEEVRTQLTVVKKIRDDIDDHSQPVGTCLDQMRQLVATGNEILSVEEISSLEKNGKELKARYDKVTDQGEKLDRKLTSAGDELRKYKTEVTSFKSWMEKSFRILEDKERNISNLSSSGRDNTKEFVSDVIAHQGDLRFITMSAQKFIDESRDYLQTLNDFRVNLPQRLPYLEGKESTVKREVTEVATTYQELLARSNKLFDRLSSLGNKQKEFQDAFNKASAWLKEVTPKAQKILSEPVAGEPKLVEDQLSRAKSLQNEILSNGRLIDTARQATTNLLNSLEELTPDERNSIEGATQELESRYQDLIDAMGEKVKDLDSALTQSQDVQDAVDSVTTWLTQAENQIKLISKPASLIRERLDEQIREVKLVQADIESHRVSIENMARSADKLISSGSRVSKRVEGKLQDVLARYEKLVAKLVERSVLLAEVSASLDSFNYSATHFEQWFLEMFEIIETKLGGENAGALLEEVMRKKQGKKGDFDELVTSGKTLVSRKDVTDTTSAKDRIKSLEQQWKDLNGALDERSKMNKTRSEQLNAYEKLRETVTTWLTSMEIRVSNLTPVALDVDVIKHQAEEIKPIIKEHRDYNVTIDKVNELGATYEASARGESPRRRLPSTPTKRSSFRSTESPTKAGSPSPFGSRRSSQETYVPLEDASPIQNQLNEINNRYHLIGMNLSDRQNELDSSRDEVKKIGDSLKTLGQFLDKVENKLPKESIPQTREEADKVLRAVKNILEELYDKQGLLDNTKTQLNDLLRRKPDARGGEALRETFDDINRRWKALQDKCKTRVGVLENIKEFHESHDSLNNWLNAKDKMMGVLGPIASDPRVVQNQLQQVQVMRDEFRAQKSVLDSFNNAGDNILAETSPDSVDGQKIEDKLMSVNQKWNDLLHKLDDREGNLDAASGASADFYNNLTKLQDNLHKISDDLDDLSLEKGKLDPEELLKKLQGIDKALESQRPVLADVQASGEQLCDILTDPTSKADIKQKLAQVGRLFNQCQKKLDNCKAEVENSKKDAADFDEACQSAQDWLGEILSQFSEKLLLSADRDILKGQVAEFEPIYKDVMSREHEIIMTINKGKELAASKSTRKNDQRTITQNLEKIQKGWDRLKKETMERNTRLQTCQEHCRKYDRARDTFFKWFTSAEQKFEDLKLSSFKKIDIDKQLKEMNVFKNDLWRHTNEYETTRALGETFLGACDRDKQGVTAELRDMKERWDALNGAVLGRVQELEDASARLNEFTDNIRDVRNALNRCEDRLASADDTKDPKLLQKIKAIGDEAAKLERPLDTVKGQGDGLCKMAQECECESDHIKETVDDLLDRYDALRAKLDDRGSDLEAAQRAMAQFNEQLKNVTGDLGGLEDEFNGMKPIGRDIPTVKSQIREIETFQDKLLEKRADVEATASMAEELIRTNLVSDAKGMKSQLENLRKQLTRLDEKAKDREIELGKMLAKLESFYELYRATDEEINELVSKEKSFSKGIGGDVESIRAQQAQFKEFRANYVEAVGKEVDECNKTGQGLIQTAPNGVSTAGIEKDLEKLNDKWNTLKEKINDQERKLDVALLNSGKFQEALAGLSKWLNDIEDMVSNQKPPSADFKVVKAQLQEQKFLNKMLLDRQPSVQSLFKMGKEIAANADAAERQHIERQLADLGERYDNLCDGAKDRQQSLEETMGVAKEFQDKLGPLTDWLERMSKKVKDMSLIPTDEEKIQKRIREHDALHDSILGKQPEFNSLADIAAALMELVGDEEAGVVADKLQDVTERYGVLVDESEALGNLLKQAKGALRHLVLSYEELNRWMDDMDRRLGKQKVISVHKDKLLQQMDQIVDLTEEIKEHEKPIDETIESGLELMKNIPNDEAIQLKEKLDALQRRFGEITVKATDLLKNAQEALPLVTQFHECHNTLSDWMMEAEGTIQGLETMSMGAQEKEIGRLEKEIGENRKVLETINLVGPQLCQLSPGEGASTIEGLVTRDNRRFDSICEQIQRRAERIHMAKQRSMEVLGDIEDLLEWFREIEGQIKDAEKPSCEPDIVRVQLQEQRALNDEIGSQKGRVRDVLATAKKVLREAAQGEDTAALREKAEDLREMMDSVSKLSSERLNALEQALPLAEHFLDTHNVLNQWMDGLEDDMATLDSPAIRPDQIMKLQDKTQAFLQSINEHKPLVDKLNKTGGALTKLCNEEDAGKVDEIMHADNERYNALKVHLREKQQALEKALQETSQFKDKLDGMLNALESTADQVNNAEPISAHPDKIREQIDENAAIIDDVKKREDAFNAVTKQANEVINKAPNKNDPAVKDIKQKLDRLNSLWDQIQKATKNRGKNLDEALGLAEKFWAELQAINEKLDALQDALKSQEPPAVEPKAIQKQQDVLQGIKKDIEKVKPDVGHCRQSGQTLMKIVGDQDKPEIKKNIEDLDSAWDNITALFAKREENLIDAMEKAMEFHETLHAILKFLDKAEQRLAGLGGIGTDINAVKAQIKELNEFKGDVDPMMVKVEALNRQAQELTERTSPDQAAKIKGPLGEVNRRWEDLLKGIVERQRELENALLRLGQFQHALNELMSWMEKTNKSLDTLKPVFGDPQVIEVELAKLKVVVNDIQAHQASVDTLNDAGRQIIESEKGSEDASKTQEKLNNLNKKWEELQRKALDRQNELEDALREAQAFAAEIQDLLFWLNDIDGALATSKPVGGLPETAAEQLARFMEIYNELETNRPKVEAVLQQGQEYLKKSTDGAATNLGHNLKTLRQRWEGVMTRANDKKIKLEIALKEANEFHKAVQDFIDWLTDAERYLTGLEPVSRVLDKVVDQVDSHRDFQKQVSSHREVMLTLEKKGNHLKYFSQKQDVILIKNLIISVQHRWDRVVSKSTERTRALDLGLKEAKEFNDSWTSLCKWLDDADKNLDEIIASAGNNPVKIKQMLVKHKEFQRILASKQPTFDSTMRMGKSLKDKAPKMDEPILRQMLADLKTKWNAVCNKSVERQRNLEEALLRSGQFKDALQELLDWLKHVDGLVVDDGPVHGDLDTVMALIEQHKKLEEQVEQRRGQMRDIVKTAEDLMETAAPEEKGRLAGQIKEVKLSFDRIKNKCDHKTRRLEEALREAEKLHKSVHLLLEWLSDAELKLRFAGSLPEDEETTRKLLEEQEKFMKELFVKEREKDETIDLAKIILAKAHPDAIPVIKHWISIIQSRWDEISSWAKQRQNKLQAHLASLRDMEDLLEELMNWLQKCEDELTGLESAPLPDDLGIIQGLIKDHKEFMEGMAKRQPEVDSVCKPKSIGKPGLITKGKPGMKLRSQTPGGGESREGSPDLDFTQHRLSSPGRDKAPELFPHIGPRFDRKGSSKAIEPQIKNPKVRGLWDKWKHVWMMAWERQRRLQDKYNYLLELEKVKNFSWDDWRKRFLKFMNYKKSRVTDIFRKIDRNNNGLIPREEFIDAIMKTKFPTSRLEMNAVADMFDHGDHMVDYMEFIAALRPDWEEKKPEAEVDIIDDEVQRQVMKCTCRQKFRVFQVGEGKYRFGDSQKLRLVRILRSTVMVRVGGGWVALDEFLVKNDPCRAKGRTNIELREQFILADGVSQTMQAFKSRPSGSTVSGSTGNRSAQSLPTAGPITKVKERSIRSVPMGHRARSTDRTTPDSTFSGRSGGGGDDGFTLSRVPRKPTTPGPGRGSTPGSRTGSKPPSRSGSNVSLDSTDDHAHGSRIPRRSTSLRRGTSGTPTSSQRLTPATTPTRPPFSLNTNAHTNGSGRGGSSERAHSFSRPPTTPPTRGGMKRTGSASSVHSLPATPGSGQRPSRIPVFVGGDGTGDFNYSHTPPRSRTPSNSNIPIAIATSTPRDRAPSGTNVSFNLHGPPTTAAGGTPTMTTTTKTSGSSSFSASANAASSTSGGGAGGSRSSNLSRNTSGSTEFQTTTTTKTRTSK